MQSGVAAAAVTRPFLLASLEAPCAGAPAAALFPGALGGRRPGMGRWEMPPGQGQGWRGGEPVLGTAGTGSFLASFPPHLS